MVKMTKTNAVRLLEKEKIPYKTAVYEYDENDLSGESAAAKMGIPCSKMYKTLVTRGDKTGINVFCIPVDCEINLKKAANATGNKNIRFYIILIQEYILFCRILSNDRFFLCIFIHLLCKNIKYCKLWL